MTTTEDLTRLPRWARERIEKLEADIVVLKADVERMTVPGASNVELVRHHPEPNAALPPDCAVLFKLSKSKPPRPGLVEVSPRSQMTGWLAVRSLEGMLVIQPGAGNLIYVRSE